MYHGYRYVLKERGCKVIIITTFTSTVYFQHVLKDDIRDFLLNDSPSEELAVSSIRSVVDGKLMYCKLAVLLATNAIW
ncbi:hypothetical protein NDK43_22800 [Neobacillus pocheonensis]|uniref:Uncharacterized protein n=1 Tax=Neobacillus pocheonensis TaxID=363869 RepID=A0ABT0WEB6_9BACI|nr:hypothetical protein [Neobacillus pocheonensis]